MITGAVKNDKKLPPKRKIDAAACEWLLRRAYASRILPVILMKENYFASISNRYGY